MDKKIAPDGTKLSGLVSSEENQPPRECHNCIWYKQDHCFHPVVRNDPDVVGTPGEPKSVGDDWCCNFFQSPGRVLLYAVRHGDDGDQNRIGGWEETDLLAEGHKDAREAGEKLKGKGINTIYCSDLERTYETAMIIAKILGLPKESVQCDFRLRTWDKGYLNGQKRTDERQKVLNEFKENPSWVIPDGESRNMFEDRCEEAFDFYTDLGRNCGVQLLVVHNSNVKELQRYCDDKGVTDESPDSVEPGGIAQVSEKKGKLTCKVIFKDRKPQS